MPNLSVALVKHGEPIPQECAPYPMRVGNLANELSSRGHRVCWFCSTFSHHNQELRFSDDTTLEELGYRQRFLHSGSYRRTISLERWFHHFRFAMKLHSELLACPNLDVLVCCIPTLEAALACLLVARRRKIPLILDVRDPWPDVFLTVLPRSLRFLGSLPLLPYSALARGLLKRADAVTACSQGFLDWAQITSGRSAEQCSRDLLVYHGAHAPLPEAEDSELPAAWQTKPGTIRHVFMGGFGRTYHFETMMEVIEELKSDPRHHFFYVGAGTEQRQKMITRLQGHDNVTFTDWLPRGQAYRLSRSCHIGWLPLRSDSGDFMPNKPFEYSSLGLAQIIGDSKEVGALMEEYGFGMSYTQGETADLVARLKALDEAQLESWKASARRFWDALGDAKQCASQFADHVEEIHSAHFRTSE